MSLSRYVLDTRDLQQPNERCLFCLIKGYQENNHVRSAAHVVLVLNALADHQHAPRLSQHLQRNVQLHQQVCVVLALSPAGLATTTEQMLINCILLNLNTNSN